MSTRAWLLFAVSTLAGVLLVLSHDDIPRLLGRHDNSPARFVEDRTRLLTAAQRDGVARYHAALLDGHDIDYRVLTLGDGGDINRNAYDHFIAAEVGSRSASGRGLLLVIDTALQRVRLEVSTSLEGVYTDAFVAYIQNRQMAPFFGSGRVADGIVATTELIVSRAQEARAGQAFAPPMPARSMGGGATASAAIADGAATSAAIGAGEDASAERERQPRDGDAAGLGPLQIVELYHRAMAERDARPDLPFYSAATVRMMRGWVVTPAQMDNVERTYRGCTVDAVRVRDDVAVVRYGVDQRQCAPYFLERDDGEWKLDLTAMSSALRFNHENQWRFETPIAARHRFAFDDWRIDRNGFPHASD